MASASIAVVPLAHGLSVNVVHKWGAGSLLARRRCR